MEEQPLASLPPRKRRFHADPAFERAPERFQPANGTPGVPPMTEQSSNVIQRLISRIHAIGNLLHRRDRINPHQILGDEELRNEPAPIYDREGKRVNTPVQRAIDRLFEERNELVLKTLELDPNFKLPAGCPPPRVVRKVYFPVREYPDVNFIGLVLGPRGLTQKRIEATYQCRLLIRGRGARSRDAGTDDLHAVVQAQGAKARENAEMCAKYLKEEILVPRRDEENAP